MDKPMFNLQYNNKEYKFNSNIMCKEKTWQLLLEKHSMEFYSWGPVRLMPDAELWTT